MKSRMLAAIVIGSTVHAAPVPDKIPCAVPDRQDWQSPVQVSLTGWMGARMDANTRNRLLKIDPDRLLEGYRKRPGRQTWDGEHVGKWLHAATLAWLHSNNQLLRDRLDHTAAELAKCQLPDGYLGTYLPKDRWTEWDVWAHKYNLLGLLSYMRHTGNLAPMPACRRMADLLIDTFGDTPGKRDIITSGQHVGMASTSVLEPMVLLYRMTGDPRDLEFCRYLLRAWEQPNGPKIISTLLAGGGVDKVGNGKAYEMLSCLNGALEYHRTVGDQRLLDACLRAWQDIVDHRLYPTGTASSGELFRSNLDLPNSGKVGETCVTVTWIQFNAQLLRLTGEARFAEELERAVLNQLFGAQRPDGSAWGYYVEMEGKKPYSSTLDGHCCLSSGPRGITLIPTFATTTDADGIVINLPEAGTAKLVLRDGPPVTVTTLGSLIPWGEPFTIRLDLPKPHAFAVKLRLPKWAGTRRFDSFPPPAAPRQDRDGYAALTKTWKPGETIEVSYSDILGIVPGRHRNDGMAYVRWGPLVLAADDSIPGPACRKPGLIALPGHDAADLKASLCPPPDGFASWQHAKAIGIRAVAREATDSLKPGDHFPFTLVPFAEVGATGAPYRIWLPLQPTRAP